MATAKEKNLRDLSESELQQKLQDASKQLFELRQKKVTGQLDKPHQFKVIKKTVARINTLLREAKQ